MRLVSCKLFLIQSFSKILFSLKGGVICTTLKERPAEKFLYSFALTNRIAVNLSIKPHNKCMNVYDTFKFCVCIPLCSAGIDSKLNARF